MAGNDGIKFSCNDKEIDITKNYSLNGMKLDAKQKKDIRSVFDAIENSDGTKGFNAEEKNLVEALKTIFANTGDIYDGNVLDKADIEFLQTFDGDLNFINKKVNEINYAEIGKNLADVKNQLEGQSNASGEGTKTQGDPQDGTIENANLPEEEHEELNQEKQAVTFKPEDVVLTGDFKKDIKAIAEKLDKEALEGEFTETYKVKSGNTIYVIARDQLKKETGKNPTKEEIYTRIAEIALLNDNMDINKPALIVVGQTIKIGKKTAANPADKGEGNKPVAENPVNTEEKTPRQNFNDAIKNIASKMDKEAVAAELTREYTIADKDTLYGIARQSLIDDGISAPSVVQINRRIAEIALVNDAINIDNIAKIPKGKTIKVGKASVENEGQAVAGAGAVQAGTGTGAGAGAVQAGAGATPFSTDSNTLEQVVTTPTETQTRIRLLDGVDVTEHSQVVEALSKIDASKENFFDVYSPNAIAKLLDWFDYDGATDSEIRMIANLCSKMLEMDISQRKNESDFLYLRQEVGENLDGIQCDKEYISKLQENGWLDKEPLYYFDGGYKHLYDPNTYGYGYDNYGLEAHYNEDGTITLQDTYEGDTKGKILAREAYDQIHISSIDNEFFKYISEYNVYRFLLDYNEKSPEEGIIEALDRKWGPTVEQMEVIPKALVKYAKSKGLKDDETPLKELIEFLNNDRRIENHGVFSFGWGGKAEKNDYAVGYARRLDGFMANVIVAIKNAG